MSGSEIPEVRPERVVILSPNGIYDEKSLSRLSPTATVEVVSFVPVDDAATILLTRPVGLAERLVRAMSPSAVGRELLRLTPLDPGVRFRRAANRDTRVRASLESADLVVVPERDGALAAWHAARDAARSDRRVATVFGYPAAQAALHRSHS
jgi:hypothetical protein